MPYRFVHTADLHLDSPLRSLSLRDVALADRVALATREAFANLVQAALEESVDAVMIAGDLFDGTQTSRKSSLFLSGELRRLHAAGIDVFIVKGNHDARSKVTAGIDLPPNVHVFDGRGGAGRVARAGDRPVVVHGVSFREAHASDSLLPRYARPAEGAIEIGLMNTSLAGAAGHDPYAPCALADLVGHGFAYWGLGHVHGRTVHHDGGDCAVVMPGMPQGRDVGERGAMSASLVTIADDGTVVLDTIPTSLVVFERVEACVPPGADWDEALHAAETALVDAAETAGAAREMVARLRLTGQTPTHWRLRRDADAFRDELGERLGGGVHVEKVAVDVVAPSAIAAPDTPIRELARDMREAAGATAFRAEATDLMDEVIRSLPKAARDLAFPPDEREAMLAALCEEGVADIAARIEGTGARDGGSSAP